MLFLHLLQLKARPPHPHVLDALTDAIVAINDKIPCHVDKPVFPPLFYMFPIQALPSLHTHLPKASGRGFIKNAPLCNAMLKQSLPFMNKLSKWYMALPKKKLGNPAKTPLLH